MPAPEAAARARSLVPAFRRAMEDDMAKSKDIKFVTFATRIPGTMHHSLRVRSVETETNQQDIVIAALTEKLIRDRRRLRGVFSTTYSAYAPMNDDELLMLLERSVELAANRRSRLPAVRQHARAARKVRHARR